MDEDSGLQWEKLVNLIFIVLSFIVLFILLALALFMPSLRD
ncbi:MAG: hypothetical protein QXK76_03110 [Candidatus Woesearchaeota archaeon]